MINMRNLGKKFELFPCDSGAGLVGRFDLNT